MNNHVPFTCNYHLIHTSKQVVYDGENINIRVQDKGQEQRILCLAYPSIFGH
jgi:hypothetical protein